MHKRPILLLMLLYCSTLRSQSAVTLEQYSFMGGDQPCLFAPVVCYETKRQWYAEARYNYEALNTFSLYAGHTFSVKRKIEWAFTPVIGGMIGELSGGSFGLNSEIQYKKFNFSSQAQYCVSAKSCYDNFFYNWSELWYQPAEWMYTGIAVQHTRLYARNALVDPGILLGFVFKRWSLPLYSFNPFSNSRYFVIGFNWEWKHSTAPATKSVPRITDTQPIQLAH